MMITTDGLKKILSTDSIESIYQFLNDNSISYFDHNGAIITSEESILSSLHQRDAFTHESLLDIKQVVDITQLAKPTIYRYINAKKFPPKISLSSRKVRWRKVDIIAWKDGKMDW